MNGNGRIAHALERTTARATRNGPGVLAQLGLPDQAREPTDEPAAGLRGLCWRTS
ncbi:MAG: hypothetical protein ACRDSQ_01970 [Actinokineospora sp.]